MTGLYRAAHTLEKAIFNAENPNTNFDDIFGSQPEAIETLETAALKPFVASLLSDARHISIWLTDELGEDGYNEITRAFEALSD